MTMRRGTKSFQHRANRNRTSESDIPNKFKVMEIIKENFGLFALTDEVLVIPNGGYARCRQPDLIIKTVDVTYIIELQGPVHNLDSDTVPRQMDDRKDEDYSLLGDRYHVIKIYGGIDNRYDMAKVVGELVDQGLPMDEVAAAHYRNRKMEHSRYHKKKDAD